MFKIENLKFDDKGLIPAIVVDTETKQVLTLAYMNAESLRISMEEGRTCFFSRSRQALWRKGETSGNVQHIVSITADCDADALVVEVRKDGPACHTGAESCFFQPVFEGEAKPGFRAQGDAEGGLLHLLPLRQGARQDPQKGRRGGHGGHHRRERRRQGQHDLRARRSHVPRDGPHARHGRHHGRDQGRNGIETRD